MKTPETNIPMAKGHKLAGGFFIIDPPREWGVANPKHQPCRTCKHFAAWTPSATAEWCRSIESDVKPWWTGCVRHSPNDQTEPLPPDGERGRR
jgi:hypothetical protein